MCDSVIGAPQTTQPVSSSVVRIASSTSIDRRHSGQTKVCVPGLVMDTSTAQMHMKNGSVS